MIRSRLVTGAAAGVAATVPMTAAMVLFLRVGVLPQLPPVTIVDRLLPAAPSRARRVGGLVAHAVYGAGAGAAFAVPAGHRASVPAGAAYGALLWAVGYEGWLPLAGILPPAHRDHRGRVLAVVAAHLVYGAALARALRR